MARRTERALRFEASARLQRLFGRDLIPDEDSAVEELVKNAYDSNASEVVITIVRGTEGHPGEIEIRDNGSGLTFREFSRLWMRAGYSEKTGQPLPGTGRVQVGEKGIGRFAADKLGGELTVITKPAGAGKALSVYFDWSRFDNKKHKLSDIPIPYEAVTEQLLSPPASGTILRIRRLHSEWTDKAIESLRRRLSQLLDPYAKRHSFQIILHAPAAKLSGPIVPSEVAHADFEWIVERSALGSVQMKRRTRMQRGLAEWSNWQRIAIEKVPLSGPDEFGPVKARFFFFVGRPKKALVGDALAGVSVFRDGMRVEPAGSSTADWLGLLEKRAKRAGHMPLVPSRLFGFVEISREDNPQLQDATNRRSFIHGPALDSFRTFLTARLDELEAQVEKEVSKPKWARSTQIKSQALVQAQYQTVSVLSLSLAHELRQPLQAIQAASDNIITHLEQNGIRIPAISAAAIVISRNVQRIDKHIEFLKSVGSGNEDIEDFDAVPAIDETIEMLREFAAARNISLTRAKVPPAYVRGNRSTFLAALTTLIQNACQAIEGQEDEDKHFVTIDIIANTKTTKVRVSDDGPGIPESVRARLFKRQTTSKKGGMGVGLYVWRQAIEMFGGDLACERFSNPTRFAITIPTGAPDGAHPTSR